MIHIPSLYKLLSSIYDGRQKYLVIKIEHSVLRIFLVAMLFSCVQIFAQSNTTLWYNRPAEYFEETLVLGNGKAGASVFGGVQSDKIYLNDATLWSGEPVDPYMNPDAYKHIPKSGLR